MLTFRDISSLTLISSESCNLNCSYCKIAKMENGFHQKEAQELRESFINGTYVDNIITIFKKYKIDPNKVEFFQYWGQEPTTTLDVLADQFPRLYSFFPNVTHSFFSTNGVNWYERILHYIEVVDKTVTHPFTIEIQISYDGGYSNEQLRGVKSEVIENNIFKLMSSLDDLNLKNVRIDISFHNVISFDLLKELYKGNDSDSNIKEFWNNAHKFLNKCRSLCSLDEKFLNFNTCMSPGLINPYNATKEEGELLVKFYEDNCRLNIPEAISTVRQFTFNFIDNTHKSLEMIDNEIRDILDNINVADIKSIDPGCNSVVGNINIRYTGEVMHCQNVAHSLTLEEIEGANYNEIDLDIKKNQLMHHAYPNIISGNADDIHRYLWKWDTVAAKYCLPHQLVFTINMMYLLAKCGQIKSQYLTEPKKLFRHAYYIVYAFDCWENNLNETASVFGQTAGLIRLLANGLCDYMDEDINNNQMQNEGEN